MLATAAIIFDNSKNCWSLEEDTTTTKIETFLEIMSLHNLGVEKAALAQNHPSV